MSGYGQFCPVAKTAELLGDRWTFLIIRELLAGSHQFNDIHRGVPKMSRTLLSRRLKMLAEAGVVRRCRTRSGTVRYELTESGFDLRPLIELLGQWGHRWLNHPVREEELDPALLIWEMRRTSGKGPLAERPVRVRFDFTDHPEFRRNLWEVSPDGRIAIRSARATRDADLKVRAPSRELAEVWLGNESLDKAVDDGRIELKGDPKLARRFRHWLGHSPYASAP